MASQKRCVFRAPSDVSSSGCLPPSDQTTDSDCPERVCSRCATPRSSSVAALRPSAPLSRMLQGANKHAHTQREGRCGSVSQLRTRSSAAAAAAAAKGRHRCGAVWCPARLCLWSTHTHNSTIASLILAKSRAPPPPPPTNARMLCLGVGFLLLQEDISPHPPPLQQNNQKKKHH